MNRVDRLFGYVLALQRGAQTASVLARRFEVSRRTAYRDLQALSELGVPIVVTPGRGYALMPGYQLPPVMLTPAEAAVLGLAGGLFRHFVAYDARTALDGALAKVDAVLPDRARSFVHEHGILWERALFAQLFDGGDRQRTLRCLALHQNDDGGWGHALEHDVRTPASNAVTTEFALGVMREFDLADAALLAATARWCAATQTEFGDFELADEFHRYPRAGWWRQARRWPPTAIAGRLAAVGAASPPLLERTRRWVERHMQPPPDAWPPAGLSLEELRGLDAESWRYRLYHYAHYFMHVSDPQLPEAPPSPTPAEWRSAIVAKGVDLACVQEDAECALGWGSTPTLPAGAMRVDLVARRLASLAAGQQEDGGWGDVHGLPQWRPLATIWALKALREHTAVPMD